MFWKKVPYVISVIAAVIGWESTLISLGEKELREIIDEGKDISVGCQFCDEEYVFTPAELEVLLQNALN